MKKEKLKNLGPTGPFALAILLGVSPLLAKDYPVANQPEFDAVLPSVQPGDALVIKSGHYRDVKLRFHAQGREGQPVTLRAETPGASIFEGSSELKIDGTHLVVTGLKFQRNANVTSIVTPYDVTVASVITFTADSHHCRLTETAIVDSGVGVTTYVHLPPGSRANRVDHCYFSNQGNIGVTFYVEAHPTQPNEHQVDHNYFGDRKPGTGNRWETIRVGHSDQQLFVSGTTVAHNLFYRCNGENECVSNKSTGNSYLYNAFIETRGQLTLRHGNRARVEGNYFFAGNDPASDGVRVIGSDHVVINNYFKGVRNAVILYAGERNPEPKGYAPVERALVAFNTIEDCANNFVIGGGRPAAPKDVRIIGNLVRARAGKILRMESASATVSYEGNIMFGAELGIPAQPGIDERAPVLKTDPAGRMVSTATAKRLPEVGKDIDGAARGQAARVGAIEAGTAPPLYPLSAADVGPVWMKN